MDFRIFRALPFLSSIFTLVCSVASNKISTESLSQLGGYQAALFLQLEDGHQVATKLEKAPDQAGELLNSGHGSSKQLAKIMIGDAHEDLLAEFHKARSADGGKKMQHKDEKDEIQKPSQSWIDKVPQEEKSLGRWLGVFAKEVPVKLGSHQGHEAADTGESAEQLAGSIKQEMKLGSALLKSQESNTRLEMPAAGRQNIAKATALFTGEEELQADISPTHDKLGKLQKSALAGALAKMADHPSTHHAEQRSNVMDAVPSSPKPNTLGTASKISISPPERKEVSPLEHKQVHTTSPGHTDHTDRDDFGRKSLKKIPSQHEPSSQRDEIASLRGSVQAAELFAGGRPMHILESHVKTPAAVPTKSTDKSTKTSIRGSAQQRTHQTEFKLDAEQAKIYEHESHLYDADALHVEKQDLIKQIPPKEPPAMPVVDALHKVVGASAQMHSDPRQKPAAPKAEKDKRQNVSIAIAAHDVGPQPVHVPVQVQHVEKSAGVPEKVSEKGASRTLTSIVSKGNSKPFDISRHSQAGGKEDVAKMEMSSNEGKLKDNVNNISISNKQDVHVRKTESKEHSQGVMKENVRQMLKNEEHHATRMQANNDTKEKFKTDVQISDKEELHGTKIEMAPHEDKLQDDDGDDDAEEMTNISSGALSTEDQSMQLHGSFDSEENSMYEGTYSDLLYNITAVEQQLAADENQLRNAGGGEIRSALDSEDGGSNEHSYDEELRKIEKKLKSDEKKMDDDEKQLSELDNRSNSGSGDLKANPTADSMGDVKLTASPGAAVVGTSHSSRSDVGNQSANANTSIEPAVQSDNATVGKLIDAKGQTDMEDTMLVKQGKERETTRSTKKRHQSAADSEAPSKQPSSPINETGQYACLIQGKNRSWTRGGAPLTWDMGKWQCMNIPDTSDNNISSLHVITGSSCNVEFFDGADCSAGKELFETRRASVNKFRYTAGKDLSNSGYNNKISSFRCKCESDVVFMYQGFLKLPGSDCEGHLPGTNFFSKSSIEANKSSIEASRTCRRNCEKLGSRCLGFKMWRMGGESAAYECSYADAFWFKSYTDLTTESYFAVDSEEREAPACFIRTFAPR